MARENLASATAELRERRFNACANRCYYACFQAAIVALATEGVRPRSRDADWGHAFVQAEFVTRLISRRKRYPARLAGVLQQLMALREIADYRLQSVSEVQAARALRTATDYLQALLEKVELDGEP